MIINDGNSDIFVNGDPGCHISLGGCSPKVYLIQAQKSLLGKLQW